MKHLIKLLTISLSCLTVTACAGFFDKDNTPDPTPLTKFTAEGKARVLWYTRAGSGSQKDYLRLIPATNSQAIFTADKNGTVTAVRKTDGRVLWSTPTQLPFTAGPTASDNLLFVGTRDGKLLALRQNDGKILWIKQLSSEMLAPAAASHGILLVKTIDGMLTALSEQTGRTVWNYQQTEPTLILHSGSAPQVKNDAVVAGFANGNLVKLTLDKGNVIWERPVATPQGSFAIQRMVDIDGDPTILNNHIYVTTYQGKLAALSFSDGKDQWQHDMSSYIGLTGDNDRIYVSDSNSLVWAFDAASGSVDWRQQHLAARNITRPSNMGNTVVLGDAEGYVHWLNKEDGHFIARIKINGSGILAAPIVDGNIAYVLTKDGHLAALTLG